MLRKILPHAAIILSGMYFVFYFIDRVNSAMAFINNPITKGLLFLLCVISIAEGLMILRDERRRVRARERQRIQKEQQRRQQMAAQRPASGPARTSFGERSGFSGGSRAPEREAYRPSTGYSRREEGVRPSSGYRATPGAGGSARPTGQRRERIRF